MMNKSKTSSKDSSPARSTPRTIRRVGSASTKPLRAKSRVKKKFNSRQRKRKSAEEAEIDELAELIAIIDKDRETKRRRVLSAVIYVSIDLNPTEDPPSKLQLAAWGCNSTRQVGNITEAAIQLPRQVQHSIGHQFISSAAGKYHSLAVSTSGVVYSFGDGRKGQLGHGNMFTSTPYNPMKMTLRKGALGALQGFPSQVTPSGIVKANADLQIGDVACGGTFSIAREIAPHEGAQTVRGFMEMEAAVRQLLAVFGESSSLMYAWAHVRQERCEIDRRAEGTLLSWGKGTHGQLGLGPSVTYCPYPSPIHFSFQRTIITQISTGDRHTLAIDNQGHLFSWGDGRHGRLGHGDSEHRFAPCIVEFFRHTIWVDFCAAGFAHSAVLTRSRASVTTAFTGWNLCLPQLQDRDDDSVETRSLSTFGRGAHGRLGCGSNRGHSRPTLVSKWPPSLTSKGMNRWQFLGVACGGAHTLALAAYPVKKCLANPYGVETVVLSWGYGTNGQLGDGYAMDRYLPVRARMPHRCEVITQISAGKSWSAALTVNGDVYTWGKGVRGELGQGKSWFSMVPRITQALASFLAIKSGYSHNVGITTARKFLNAKIKLQEVRKEAADVCGAVFGPLPGQMLTLEKRASTSAYRFDCCRRMSAHPLSVLRVSSPGLIRRERLRFDCDTCKVTSICYNCAHLCHRFHEVVYSLRNPAEEILSLPDENDEPSDRQHLKRRMVCFDSYNHGRLGLRSCKSNSTRFERVPLLSDFKGVELFAVKRFNLDKERRAHERHQKKERRHISRPSSSAASSPLVSPDRKKKIGPEARVAGSRTPSASLSARYREHPSSSKERTDEPKKTNNRNSVPLPHSCRCGLFNLHCRMIPTIPEVDFIEKTIIPEKEDKQRSRVASAQKKEGKIRRPLTGSDRVRLTMKQQNLDREAEDVDRDIVILPDKIIAPFHAAARVIKRVLFSCLKRWRERSKRIQRTILIREAAIKHYKANILQPIFEKVKAAYAKFREGEEMKDMRYEEKIMKKYLYFSDLQKALRGMNAMMYCVRKVFAAGSAKTPTAMTLTKSGDEVVLHSLKIHLAHEAAHLPPKSKVKQKKNEPVKAMETHEYRRPTFAFTVASVRFQQLCLHPSRRAPIHALALLARRYPRTASTKGEGVCSDVDMQLFTDRFLRDSEAQAQRFKRGKEEAQALAARKRLAVAVLQRLIAKQNRTRDILAQADNTRKPPPPPPGPPPREAVRAALQEEKDKRNEKEEQIYLAQATLEVAPFGGKKGSRAPEKAAEVSTYNPSYWPRRRRASIADPSQLYSRIVDLPQKLKKTAFHRRRLSVPSLEELRQFLPKKRDMLFRETGTSTGPGHTEMADLPPPSSAKLPLKQVGISLDLFRLRQYMLDELMSELKRFEENSKMYKPEDRITLLNVFNKKIRTVLGHSCLSPRLPAEMIRIVKPSRHYAANFKGLFRSKEVIEAEEGRAASRESNRKQSSTATSKAQMQLQKEKEKEKKFRTAAAYRERRNTIAEPERLRSQIVMMLETRMKFAKLVCLTREGYSMHRRRRSFDGAEEKDANCGVSRKLGYEIEQVRVMATTTELLQDSLMMEDRMIRCGMVNLTEAREGGNDNDTSGNTYVRWLRKDDEPVSGLVSSFRDRRQPEDFLTDEDRKLLEISQASEIKRRQQKKNADIWQEHFTDDDTPYFYNVDGDFSLWQLPTGSMANIQVQVQCEDEDGNLFWLNESTGEIEPMQLLND